MARSSNRSVVAHDVPVRIRRPWLAAILCLLTLGIAGAFHHQRMTRDIARFGRARGAMPFPFVPVNPAASTLAWVAGLLAWYVVVASIVGYALAYADGLEPTSDDVTGFTSLALLLAPLWLVANQTARRIRTVQHLAGAPGRRPSPVRAALLTSLFPPLGTWMTRRELNRAWQVYR